MLLMFIAAALPRNDRASKGSRWYDGATKGSRRYDSTTKVAYWYNSTSKEARWYDGAGVHRICEAQVNWFRSAGLLRRSNLLEGGKCA